MNNVSLIGRLTAAPEIKTTQSGISLTHFSIAVDRQYSKDKEKETDFLDCTAWRGTAEFICKYFSKGQRIALTGSIRTGSYTDRDGNKRYTFDVQADNVEFCEPKRNDNSSQTESNTNDDGDFTNMPNDEDLLF